ncbi:MAG: HEAT repeat domain-containing protein [Planctomycetota bacterium]|nr:HEAT repeat domain-containing protein [Planctomycetota bacterium]
MRTVRVLSVFFACVLFLCCLCGAPPYALGGDEEKEKKPQDLCNCLNRNGCEHFLRLPTFPADEWCACKGCAELGAKNCCTKAPKKEWNEECFNSKSMDCYLRRHGASWRLDCSECRSYRKQCCQYKDWELCPECGKGEIDEKTRKEIDDRKRKAHEASIAEKDVFLSTPIVIRSDHFYLAIDIPMMKVGFKGRMRDANTHELAHIFVERAERAWKDFADVFGTDGCSTIKFYLTRQRATSDRIAYIHMKNQRVRLQYGASCMFVTSIEESGFYDDMHFYVRHMVGHCMMSMYRKFMIDHSNMPMWLYCGAADWLSRLPEPFRDKVVICSNEKEPEIRSGGGWTKRIQSLVSAGKNIPFAEIMIIKDIGKMSFDMLIHAWSYFEFMKAIDPKTFQQIAGDVKSGKDVREAFQKRLNCSPEEFEQDWKNWVMGKGKTVGKMGQTEVADGAGEMRKALRDLLAEKNTFVQASMITGLGEPTDVKTAEVVVGFLSSDAELVRTSALLSLCTIRTDVVREWMWSKALFESQPIERAFVARAIGTYKDKRAFDYLVKALADAHWLARANAAEALALLGDAKALSSIKTLLDDPIGKVRIAAIDAISKWKGDAKPVIGTVIARLKDGAWQVRSSTVLGLAEIGDKEGIGPIIERMETEIGRVQEDMSVGLKKLTGLSFGMTYLVWKDWWDHNKTTFEKPPEGSQKERPETAPRPGTSAGIPTYYGIRIFSSHIVFILDVSDSMKDNLTRQPTYTFGEKTYDTNTKIGVARQELCDAIQSLDPRTRFNMIFFGTDVWQWKSQPVEASEGNKKTALGIVRSKDHMGTTNYYDSFKKMFGIEGVDKFDHRFLSNVDTAFFLTDGLPTDGEITKPPEIYAWFRERNKFARIRLHAIAFGTGSMDVEFLKKMAKESDGKFVQIGGE